MSPRRTQQVYQLKITLMGIEPPVWRRVLVSGEATLYDLHKVIQMAMGWTDSHLHQFIVCDEHYSIPSLDDSFPVKDERKYRISQIAPRPGSKFVYEYDFGDGWQHEVVVERIARFESEFRYPVCLAGERACPPEDVGGVWGYRAFVEAMRNPKHKEHRHYKDWWGSGKFDPEAFDLIEANWSLQQIDAIEWWDEVEDEGKWWLDEEGEEGE